MKTIVLGNAPSVLFNEFGDKVDTFDNIIRMNMYEIEGYEKYVGTKTNIYSRTHNPEYWQYDALDYDEVWLKPQWKRWRDKYGILPLKNMEEGNIKELTTGKFQGGGSQSTGYRTIIQAMDTFCENSEPLYIYGFNFFNQKSRMGTPCPRPHYYIKEAFMNYDKFNEGKIEQRWHDVGWHKERDSIIDMVKDGKIIPLWKDEIFEQLDYTDFEPPRKYCPPHMVGITHAGFKYPDKEGYYD